MSKVQLLSLLLAAMTIFPVSAQTSKALISGIVTDGSGAAITNAKITITDVQRNQDYRTETNASGVYRVIELTPSVYRVTGGTCSRDSSSVNPARASAVFMSPSSGA